MTETGAIDMKYARFHEISGLEDLVNHEEPLSAAAGPSLRDVLSVYEELLKSRKLRLVPYREYKNERPAEIKRLNELEARAEARVRALLVVSTPK